MFIDNCRAHLKEYPKLKNIVVRFFPPNITSKCQPIEMGIINSLKCHYANILSSKKIWFYIKNLIRKFYKIFIILKKSFRCAENNCNSDSWITVRNTHEFRDKGANVCLRKVL